MARYVVVSIISSKEYLQSVYDRLIKDGYHPTWIPVKGIPAKHKKHCTPTSELFYIARRVEKDDVIYTAPRAGKVDMSKHFAFVDA